jgi:hypothetical protein
LMTKSKLMIRFLWTLEPAEGEKMQVQVVESDVKEREMNEQTVSEIVPQKSGRKISGWIRRWRVLLVSAKREV